MLANKAIVIIGGTSGIGLSAAKSFVGHGARVTVVGRNPDTCEQAQQTLGEQGRAMVGDATDETTAMAAISESIEFFDGFDGLYHVAGGSGRKFGDGPAHELTLEGWNKTLELNLTSLMLSNRAAVNTFLERGMGGTILNMGSVLGFSPSPEFFSTHAYAACKSAVIGFSKSMASYYANKDIRINVLAPALVETPMATRAAQDPEIIDYISSKQPLDGGRIGQAQDLDGAALFFMSDQSRFCTGQVLAVDGGWSITEAKNR